MYVLVGAILGILFGLILSLLVHVYYGNNHETPMGIVSCLGMWRCVETYLDAIIFGGIGALIAFFFID